VFLFGSRYRSRLVLSELQGEKIRIKIDLALINVHARFILHRDTVSAWLIDGTWAYKGIEAYHNAAIDTYPILCHTGMYFRGMGIRKDIRVIPYRNRLEIINFSYSYSGDPDSIDIKISFPQDYLNQFRSWMIGSG
jgi:hypothetical protein